MVWLRTGGHVAKWTVNHGSAEYAYSILWARLHLYAYIITFYINFGCDAISFINMH